jgi:signal peptidase I
MQNTPPEHIMQTATKNDLKRSITGTIKGFLSFVSFIATVVIAALLINQFVFQSYYVDGTSMTPALQNDDRLIIEKVSKTLAGVQGKAYVPNRGDIIVLDSAVIEELGHNEQLIKRVIGLPGETVVVNEGVVTIKNQQQPQGFNADSQLGLIVEPTYTTARLQVTVPEGSVFVLGDNRAMNGSFDSRSFGPISLDKIEGRLSLRIFPFDRIQTY